MNDVTKCNDKQEMLIIKKYIVNSIHIFCNKNKDGKNIKIFENHIMHKITDWFDEDHQIYKYFVVCLSEHRDSELMWARYGDHDRGICIGFETSHIKIEDQMVQPRNMELKAIKYIDSHDKNINVKESELLMNIKSIYDEYNKKFASRSKDNCEFDSVLDIYVGKLFKIAVWYKDLWWHDENEHRLAICQPFKYGDDFDIKSNNGISITKCGFNSVKDNYYRFIDFSNVNSIIKEIIIGPKNDISKQYIQDMLCAKGLKNKIIVSKSRGMVQ